MYSLKVWNFFIQTDICVIKYDIYLLINMSGLKQQKFILTCRRLEVWNESELANTKGLAGLVFLFRDFSVRMFLHFLECLDAAHVSFSVVPFCLHTSNGQLHLSNVVSCWVYGNTFQIFTVPVAHDHVL